MVFPFFRECLVFSVSYLVLSVQKILGEMANCYINKHETLKKLFHQITCASVFFIQPILPSENRIFKKPSFSVST
jgi:hypothetical protein